MRVAVVGIGTMGGLGAQKPPSHCPSWGLYLLLIPLQVLSFLLYNRLVTPPMVLSPIVS